MAFVHPRALDAVSAWLRDGQDVRLAGDTGAGRSTVLRELFERLRAAGTDGVLLRGSAAARDLPLAAFATHLGIEPPAARWGLPEATRALAERVRDRGVVLLDDVHLLDRSSLAAVAAVVAQSTGRLRVVATAPDGVDLGVAARGLLRGAVRETVDPLDVGAVATLLGDVLGGQVEIGLATAIAGRSAGNPRTAAALAVGARRAGSVARVRGRWTQTGTLDTVPADAVIHGLVADVSATERRGLDTLASFGVLDLAHARRFLGDDVVAVLAARGRLVAQDRDGAMLAAVSPPALAQALRLSLSRAQRASLLARLDDGHDDAAAAPVDAGTRPTGDDTTDAAARIVTLLLESGRRQAALWRSAWGQAPTVANALPLLRLRLLDDVRSIDVDDVFARTALGEQDHPEDVASYVLLRAQWAACQGRDLVRGLTHDPGPSGRVVLDGLGEPFVREVRALYEPGAPALARGAFDERRDVPAALRSFARLLLVQADIDAGAPDAALDRLGASRGSQRQAPFAHQLDAARGDALLMVGQVADAVAWAHGAVSAATDGLDLFGTRLAVRGLATAQFVAGDDAAALRTLGVALRLGRSGPVQAPYDERIFGLAAVLHARRGELDVARAMLDELEATPRPFVLPLDVMRPWARTEIASVESGGAPEAADELWAAGEERYAAGQLMSAAFCWIVTPAVLTPARLDRLERLVTSLDLPTRYGLLALHRAMARGTSDAILAAVPVGARGALVEVALATARRRAADEGAVAVADSRIATIVGGRLERRPTEVALTEREAEIAGLAGAGLTNRQIASRLFLSVRTVESHLYRAMQKLGLSDRADLRAALERPEAAR